jgi:hypothetical protein
VINVPGVLLACARRRRRLLIGGRLHCAFSGQFGRASAPMIPHLVQTMRGPNVGTGTWSGHGSALRTAFYRRATTDPQLLEHAVHMRIIDASCTENGSDGGDGSPEGTDKLSTSVTNRVCVSAGKAAKSASQYWTHRDLKAS